MPKNDIKFYINLKIKIKKNTLHLFKSLLNKNEQG